MEQRACYRVATHLALDQFELMLELPDGTSCPARMDDVSARGLMARTSHPVEPALRKGARVTLVISYPARSISLRLTAVVRGVNAHSDKPWYGLAFMQPERLARELPADLFSLFNRRRSPRLPLQATPLSLATTAGERALGTLRDISHSGVSICVPFDQDLSFCIGERVSMSGRLSEAGEAVRLVGHVRRVHRTDTGWTYGIEFAWNAVASLDQRPVVEQFIAHLQRSTPQTGLARRIAERRISQRARPPVDARIHVELWGDGRRSAQAQLLDLSTTGVGVVVAALEDPEFGDDETMRVRLRLPDGELGFVAKVRRGLLVDDHVCYGLEFDMERTHNFSACQELIRSFVASHVGPQEELPKIAVG